MRDLSHPFSAARVPNRLYSLLSSLPVCTCGASALCVPLWCLELYVSTACCARRMPVVLTSLTTMALFMVTQPDHFLGAICAQNILCVPGYDL
jgi:hypothetical protein